MTPHQNQRVTEEPSTPTDGSNRQSYDREAPTDAHQRPIDYLTESEVDRLIKGAKRSRNPLRNALLILMLFRHGLRETEAIMLRRDGLKLDAAVLWVHRIKGGSSTHHPIEADELRLLRRYLRTREDSLPWLFISERQSALSDRSVRLIVKDAADRAKLPHVHPHMLRHSCGFYLNGKGYNARLIQDYLGHRDPKSTMIYTRTAAKQFEGLFQ